MYSTCLFCHTSLGTNDAIEHFPVGRRLAFEMALHEEQERRAMEGELRALEQAWRDAEEIATIADNFLVPDTAEEWLRKHRGQAG